jgi:Protein of unknown function (DUF3109)
MILIDTILMDDAIITTPFLCDTKQCKGACCTVKGGQGAPVLDSEVEEIQRAIKPASKYLTTRSKEEIRQYGAIEGSEGDYTTRCIEDRDCVFVFYEENIAKCAIERAWFNNESSFRKPLSCHLFPIRLSDFNGPYLYYDEFPECAPALAHGTRHDVRMPETVKDALIRAFGEEWYAKLQSILDDERTRAMNHQE